MTFWLALNSAVIAIVAGLLYLTIRQVGLLLQRSGPLGARHHENMGPRIGENISPHVGKIRKHALRAPRPTLYVFVSNACSICRVVEDAAMKLVPHWNSRADILVVHDDTPPLTARPAAVPLEGFGYVLESDVRNSIGVTGVPYAVITDGAGVVLGHGLVNATSHLESLLELLESEEANSFPMQSLRSPAYDPRGNGQAARHSEEVQV